MEVKEVERVVITKPVASKPSCSSFKSFSEMLAGAINASPSPDNSRSETAVSAIRPKTVRAKPTVNRASTAMPSSQGEVSKLPEGKSSVLYKPLAKVVSKATVSLLASMGNPNITHQQALAQVEARAQHFNHQSKLNSNQAEKAQQDEIPKKASEGVEEEPKAFIGAANVDRPSYDGYNWRKYGQKQVKGSEYPRSYYKCTHPNCPVKKKVERTFDGQIAEIVYRGEHSHPKPQPPKRSLSDPKWSNNVSERRLEGNLENCYPTKQQLLLPYDPPHAPGSHSCGRSADCEEGSRGFEADDGVPRNKRRKSGNTNNEVMQEPRVSVQSGTETEIVGDGFRWRKYGQKVVKGNPYPRSYYKCTSLKCNVRKYVERASDEPSAFLTTYEGKHNHDMPTKIASSAGSQPDSQAPTNRKL